MTRAGFLKVKNLVTICPVLFFVPKRQHWVTLGNGVIQEKEWIGGRLRGKFQKNYSFPSLQ